MNSNPLNSSRTRFNAAAPPSVGAKNTPAEAASDEISDTFAAQAPQDKVRLGWKHVAMATSALLSFSATAQAQTQPPQEVSLAEVTTDPVCCDEVIDLEKKPEEEEPLRIGVTGTFMNDNMPTFIGDHVIPEEHRTPSGNFADDDRWTAELQLESNFRKGDREIVVGGRLMMLTEDGFYAEESSGATGKRTDIGEFAVQYNQRLSLSENSNATVGLGFGVQAFGDLGGEGLQRWWHQDGPFGGRTGSFLQSDQVIDSTQFAPIATFGARYESQINPFLSVNAAAQGRVPLGNGLGVVQLKSGVRADLGPIAVEGGVKVDGTWSNVPEIGFLHEDGVYPGAYGRVELGKVKGIGVFSQVEVGGFRNEPQFTAGIQIGTEALLSLFQ